MMMKTLIVFTFALLVAAPAAAQTDVQVFTGKVEISSSAADALKVTGSIQVGDGTVSNPAIASSSDAARGMYFPAADQIAWATDGVLRMRLAGRALTMLDASANQRVALDSGETISGLGLASDHGIAWSSGSNALTGHDLTLWRGGADTLEQRRTTNPQEFWLSGTWTDASNYERIEISAGATLHDIRSESAGTGTVRPLRIYTVGASELRFGTNNTIRWHLDTSGNLLADGAFNIGDGAGGSPVTVYAETSFSSDTTAGTVLTHARQSMADNGVIILGDNTTLGLLAVTIEETGSVCFFTVNGLAETTGKLTGAVCNTAAGGTTFNVYWDAVDARYEAENSVGAARDVQFIWLGKIAG